MRNGSVAAPAAWARATGLTALWLAGCASDGKDGGACSVERGDAALTIRCPDGSEETLSLSDGDAGGLAEACQVSSADGQVTITCPSGAPVRFPLADPDAGIGAGSCSASEEAAGYVRISCPDGSEATIATLDAATRIGPAQAACVGCHDGPSARAHFAAMTAQLAGEPAESCATCHAETSSLRPVSSAHARPEAASSDLRVEILDAIVKDPGRQVRVSLHIQDAAGQPLSPSVASWSFVLAKVPAASSAVGTGPIAGPYQSYLSRTVTQVDLPEYPLSGDPRVVQQPTSEAGGDGTFIEVASGLHDYTFAFPLPEDHDPSQTHVVGLYATRTVAGVRSVANATHFFVPDHSRAPLKREAVHTATCNGCHNPLSAHGGARRDVQLCLTCHTQGAVDPETGNSIDFNVMIHRLHAGASLPSVQAGEKYAIVGFRSSVHDYSHVRYPRSTLHCQSCHTESDDTRWITNGTRAACMSCHDRILEPGAHPFDLVSEVACGNAVCHADDGNSPTAVTAHRTFLNQDSAPVFDVTLLSVTAAAPDQRPRVRIRALTGTRTTGAVIPVTSTAALSMLHVFLNGPNTDFRWDGHNLKQYDKARLRNLTHDDQHPGELSFELPESLRDAAPAGAQADRDSFTLAIRAQYDPTPDASPDDDRVDMSRNPVMAFTASGGPATARQPAVETDKCNRCHGDLRAHGGATLAKNVEQCLMCHTASMDTRTRQAANKQPGATTSLRLSTMVHRIHGAAIAEDPFVAYGHASMPPYPEQDLSQLGFPGDPRDCLACHRAEDYLLPLVETRLPTTTVVLDADGGVVGD